MNFTVNQIKDLEFGGVKFGMNKTTILYMLDLPITERETCKSIFVKPLKKNSNVTINLDNEKFIKCKNSVYEIKKPCKIFSDVCIRENYNIDDISNSNCLPKLLHGKPSKWPTTNHQ